MSMHLAAIKANPMGPAKHLRRRDKIITLTSQIIIEIAVLVAEVIVAWVVRISNNRCNKTPTDPTLDQGWAWRTECFFK